MKSCWVLKVTKPRRLGTFESRFSLLSGNVVLICLVLAFYLSLWGGIRSMHMRCAVLAFASNCAKRRGLALDIRS